MVHHSQFEPKRSPSLNPSILLRSTSFKTPARGTSLPPSPTSQTSYSPIYATLCSISLSASSAMNRSHTIPARFFFAGFIAPIARKGSFFPVHPRDTPRIRGNEAWDQVRRLLLPRYVWGKRLRKLKVSGRDTSTVAYNKVIQLGVPRAIPPSSVALNISTAAHPRADS